MTGRDLVLYIMKNHLEDEEIFKDERLLGFMTVNEVAVRENVGVHTVYTWISQSKLDHVIIGDTIFIPADYQKPTAK